MNIDLYDTQAIDIATMDTLQMGAIKLDETVKTPVPTLPTEVSCGPGWELYQHGTSYALVLYTLYGPIELPLDSGQLMFLGIDIHSRYRKLEER